MASHLHTAASWQMSIYTTISIKYIFTDLNVRGLINAAETVKKKQREETHDGLEKQMGVSHFGELTVFLHLVVCAKQLGCFCCSECSWICCITPGKSSRTAPSSIVCYRSFSVDKFAFAKVWEEAAVARNNYHLFTVQYGYSEPGRSQLHKVLFPRVCVSAGQTGQFVDCQWNRTSVGSWWCHDQCRQSWFLRYRSLSTSRWRSAVYRQNAATAYTETDVSIARKSSPIR